MTCPQSAPVARSLAMYRDPLTGPIANFMSLYMPVQTYGDLHATKQPEYQMLMTSPEVTPLSLSYMFTWRAEVRRVVFWAPSLNVAVNCDCNSSDSKHKMLCPTCKSIDWISEMNEHNFVTIKFRAFKTIMKIYDIPPVYISVCPYTYTLFGHV